MQKKRRFLTPIAQTLEKPLTVGFAVRCEPSRERSATPTLIPATKIGRAVPPILPVYRVLYNGLILPFLSAFGIIPRGEVLSRHTGRNRASNRRVQRPATYDKTAVEPAHCRFAVRFIILLRYPFYHPKALLRPQQKKKNVYF